MAENLGQEKTESATTRRREEARNKGQVAQSNDLSQAVLLLAGICTLLITGPGIAATLRRMLRYEFLLSHRDSLTEVDTTLLAQALVGNLLEAILPLMGTMMFTAVAISVLQSGFRVSFEPLSADWTKLDLSKGWDRLFSLRSVIRTVMLLIKLSLGILTTVWFLRSQQDTILLLGQKVLTQSVSGAWSVSLNICLALAGTLLAIGMADLLFQRWQTEQDLMMTKQEVKDEGKQEEGDPQIRGRMRKMARENLKLQMLRRVPEATVVLTNPTHIAVALKYDRESMSAPKVIAKGTDAFARRIADLAKQHGIPVLERKPLARAIFASVDVDQDIPPNLYRAIAEILAYLYRTKN
jgi:flagellar biosynthesis protein FlhB